MNSKQFLDSIFLSYNKILNRLHTLGITTKYGKEISHMDLRKAIKKICDSKFEEYKFLVDNKVIISSKNVEWICKNLFKQKYLGLLEKYKMELIELYIEAGYPYYNFFFKN